MSVPKNQNNSSYQGYKGLRPLVGMEKMEDATHKGLSVEESVRFLKRHHWMLRGIRQTMLFHLASTPVYEIKMAFSLHAHLCSEHITAIRTRVSEMREPPLGLDKVPHRALDRFLEEIRNAPDMEGVLLGLYGIAIPALLEGVELHLNKTHRLFDHPTYRLCRLLKLELEEMLDYGQHAIDCLIDKETDARYQEWITELVDTCLQMSLGKDGNGELPCRFTSAPAKIELVPARDERFTDSYNQGVNAEAFLFDDQFSPQAKTLMMFFKRLREIDVPEMMAPLIYEERQKGDGYMRDMCRQLWDEARHAMMGEIGFYSLGIDWREIPISINFSLGLNTLASARERHAVLWYIEQGLMPAKGGKAEEWEIAIQSESKLAAMIQDYDWADEVLHARIGRDWLVPQYGSKEEAREFGNTTWSRIMTEYQNRMQSGLTDHRNWWPEVYLQACETWGIEPDPNTVSYNRSYLGTRADLKTVE